MGGDKIGELLQQLRIDTSHFCIAGDVVPELVRRVDMVAQKILVERAPIPHFLQKSVEKRDITIRPYR